MAVTINGTSGITFPAGGTGNPAGTVVGTTDTQTLTNKTVDGSQLVAGSVTSTQLATAVQPVGNGQTWQNLTGSRALSTTYTNSTGRPIAINVQMAASSTTSQINLNVNSAGAQVFGQAIWGISLFAIIPTGATYSVTGSGGSPGALGSWQELR